MPDGAHSIDPFRLIPSTCQVTKTFVSNDKFKLVSGSPEVFVNGKLGFARGEEKPDGTYKTYFGPCYYHPGVVYAADDVGLEMAFNYRLGCVREPDKPGYHSALCRNQGEFFSENAELAAFAEAFRIFLAEWFLKIGDLDKELIAYANQPHPKRRLRLRALQNILDNGDFFHPTFNRKVTGKVKRAELAKFLKATRLINDLTTEGSLLCGFVADQIKCAQAEFTRHTWYQFIKSPQLSVLTEVFDKLTNPTDKMYFAFFSDDSCVSIRCADGVFMANVDISSCDASHTRCVFDLLRHVCKDDTRLFRYVDGAIKQCEMPLHLRSGIDGTKVGLKPNAPTLYSGSTLTTLINNFANLAIAFAIHSRLYDGITKAECSELVRFAAETAGYIVTVVVCDTYHKLQFLKHSPCRTVCGKLVPVLNLGVLLRSQGCCWGDVPTYRKTHGLLTFEQRCHLWNVSLVQCYKNCASHDLLSTLRRLYHSSKDIVSYHDHWNLNHLVDDFSNYVIPSHEIAQRYNVTTSDIMELSCCTKAGAMINTIASRAILQMDYGLE